MEYQVDHDGTLFDQSVIRTNLLKLLFYFGAVIDAPELVVLQVYVVYQDVIKIHFILVIPYCKFVLLFAHFFLLFCHFLHDILIFRMGVLRRIIEPFDLLGY